MAVAVFLTAGCFETPTSPSASSASRCDQNTVTVVNHTAGTFALVLDGYFNGYIGAFETVIYTEQFDGRHTFQVRDAQNRLRPEVTFTLDCRSNPNYTYHVF